MCLLGAVLSWDDERILCRAESHRASDNPLRREGRLSTIHALEYAAQAMAAHGRLLGLSKPSKAMPGFIAGVKSLRLHVIRLDDIDAPLEVEATRLLAMGANVLYGFRVSAAGRPVAEGRVTVVVSPGELP
jgi:predicted hotdog family 3-hydroxylacyl-ACP dehydratase